MGDYNEEKNPFLNKNKYLQTLMSIPDGVMIVNSTGQVEFLNPAGETLTGWKQEAARGEHYSKVMQLSHAAEVDFADPFKLNEDSFTSQEIEEGVVLTGKDGCRYYLEASVSPLKNNEGEIKGKVIIFRDATEKIKEKAKREYLIFHDSLTGIYNRNFFIEELSRLDTSRNLPISIVMADLNDLKLTNDIFGDAAGDRLIQQAAESFKEACRDDDIIARWGGDEFVVLLPQTGEEGAKQVITRVQDTFASKALASLTAGISLGVSTKTKPEGEFCELLDDAEIQMYSNKIADRMSSDNDNVDKIIALLYEKSRREKDHAENVADLALALGKKMKLEGEALKQLQDAALFHDIGKVALSAELLNKEDEFTSNEYREFKLHPVISYRILNYFAQTKSIAEYALSHHENWDGSGYPRGIEAEEIPLYSRIIAVVEAYEKLTRFDSSRSIFSKEEVLFELDKQAGKKLDPELVRLFKETRNSH
ncbi:MAG: HD domain-containing phosphohydrolase [Bacillota bacterium]